ncbi:helix-turn-helix domain-containing protein [Gracilibacillus sp. S3-1-1]|uniref:Helix-turn-helix domain-containing protein n=1 Tax=Gracilibacillus pellucidus TaxID=3095368 RepID=A0ACC6M3Y0_9BACI|nr:helix-turn-helix domain-containing protein [Gracilibacillus sp. S3-1-1]MDX8045447.1 helix-turn-helix domain-containing protein [Gracilibacillus sp. S3-1-1]
MEAFKPQLEPIKRSTLTVEEVAEYLGISTDMVYKMVREKALVHFRIGRRILFKRHAIDEWIDKQMQEVMEDEQ